MNPNRAAITWLEKAILCMDKAQGIVRMHLNDHPDFEFVERALNQLNNDACEAIDDIEGLGP